jgi:hypothetical protein
MSGTLSASPRIPIHYGAHVNGEPDILMGAAPLFYVAYAVVGIVLPAYAVLRFASSKVGLRTLRAIVHWIYRRR